MTVPVPAGSQQWFVTRQLTPDVNPLYRTPPTLSLFHALEVRAHSHFRHRLELFLTLSHGRWLCLSIYLSLPTLPPVPNNFMSSFYLLNVHAHDSYLDHSFNSEISKVIFTQISHYSPLNMSNR